MSLQDTVQRAAAFNRDARRRAAARAALASAPLDKKQEQQAGRPAQHSSGSSGQHTTPVVRLETMACSLCTGPSALIKVLDPTVHIAWRG